MMRIAQYWIIESRNRGERFQDNFYPQFYVQKRDQAPYLFSSRQKAREFIKQLPVEDRKVRYYRPKLISLMEE